MKKIILVTLLLFQSFLGFSQSKWKDFVKNFPAMPLDVNIECGNTLNLQVLNSIDGKKYLSDNKSDISIYYKVGKIIFHNGNLGLAYAVRSGERLYYSIDIFDKNGKFKDSYALGTSYSVGGGSLFKIMKAEKKYKVWQKNTESEGSFILGENGLREW
jgi:hypothetical protein